jgi:hypothetical protein
MVTGYLSSAIGLYQQASADRRYNKKECLDMVVTDEKHYPTSYGGLSDALKENMTQNVYCLYPCEPNFTYTMCK